MTEPDTVTNESESNDVDFYNPFDGIKGRAEGHYLDIQERREAEKLRAVAEDREPELDDNGALPFATGTPATVDGLRVDNSVYSNPTAVLDPREVDPVTTLPVDTEATGTVDADTNYRDMISGENNENIDAETGEPTGESTPFNDQNPDSSDYPTGPSGETLSNPDDEYLNDSTK